MENNSKAALRRAALSRRAALLPAELTRHSELLGEQLVQHFPVSEWRWLHVFLPIVAKSEPDNWLIIRRLWAENRLLSLAAPVVQPDGISLKNYALTPETPLFLNSWGILEPAATPETEVPPAAFDAVLVPLLVVNVAGHRVGYGGGFYDRFLAKCRPDCLFIGLQVLDEPPVPAIANVLPTDIRLTACLTPGGVWHF